MVALVGRVIGDRAGSGIGTTLVVQLVADESNFA
jgi:hypothetical protein